MSYADEVLADDPLAYWRLGEASGTAMADSSGHVHTGTRSGGVLGFAGAPEGDPDTALNLAGGMVVVAHHDGLEAEFGLTLEAWMFPPAGSTDAQKAIVQKGFTSHTDPFYEYALLVGGGDSTSPKALGVQASMAGVFRGLTVDPAPFTYDAWNHIVGTYDAVDGVMAIYCNGELVGSRTIPFAGLSHYGQPVTIGNYANTSVPWSAGLDEVAIYGRALTLSAVRRHWCAGRPSDGLCDTTPPALRLLQRGDEQEIGSGSPRIELFRTSRQETTRIAGHW